MGKRRNTAKTGDKALYQNRDVESSATASKKKSHNLSYNANDNIYDEVEQYHNKKDIDHNNDYLRLDGGIDSDDDSDHEDENLHVESVMELGQKKRSTTRGGQDDADSDNSSSEDEEDDDDKDAARSNNDDEDEEDVVSSSDDENEVSSSSDDDENDTMEENNFATRMWGTKKSAYYHGDDTAAIDGADDDDDDNNDSDDEKKNDAYLEEQAAKEIQAARYQTMSEKDFVLSSSDDDDEADDEEDDDDHQKKKQKKKVGEDREMVSSTTTKIGIIKKTPGGGPSSRLHRQKRLERYHNEFMPLVHHFKEIVEHYTNQTSIATDALFSSSSSTDTMPITDGDEEEDVRMNTMISTAETVGATKHGQQYLLTKAMLESSSALNLTMYLLLKSQYEQQTKSQQQDVDNMDMDAAGAASTWIQNHPVMGRLQKLNTLLEQLDSNVEKKVVVSSSLPKQIEQLVQAAEFMKTQTNPATNDDDIDDDDDDEASEDDEVDSLDDHKAVASVKNSISSNKKQLVESNTTVSSSDDDNDDDVDESKNVLTEARFGLRPNEMESRSKQKRQQRSGIIIDAGDEEDDYDNEHDEQTTRSNRKNAMQSLARTVNTIEQRSATHNKRRRPMPQPEHLDVNDENNNDADAELKRGFQMMEAELGKESDEEYDEDYNNKKKKKTIVSGKQTGDEYDDDADNNNDFYDEMNRRHLDKRLEREEKYKVAPKYPRMGSVVEGERVVSQMIIKNRGLVAHKNKLNRNPRVKKREQYRVALIRRRGAVREIRTDEGHQYGGESTGIKKNISRSRKFAG